MPRLFFALQPALAQNVALLESIAPVIALLGSQPVPAENLHATLCFIGEVEAERLDALREAVSGLRARPVEVGFDRLEYWETPKILCATTSGNTSAAESLSVALSAAASAAGFSPDIKPLRAHLTLARKIPAARASEIPRPLPLESVLLLRADSFVLMSSHREGERSIYSVVNSWPLYG